MPIQTTTTQRITATKERFTLLVTASLLAVTSLITTGCSSSETARSPAGQPTGQWVSQSVDIQQQTLESPAQTAAWVTDRLAEEKSVANRSVDFNKAFESEIDPGDATVRYEETSEIDAGDAFLRAEGRDTTYAQQPFDGEIYNQLQTAGFCVGIGDCSDASYLFSDAILSARAFERVSTDITIIPHLPVSKEVALAYASILDTEADIDFTTAQIDTDISTETYFEQSLPTSEAAIELGSARMAQLRMTPSGMVSEISFSFMVF